MFRIKASYKDQLELKTTVARAREFFGELRKSPAQWKSFDAEKSVVFRTLPEHDEFAFDGLGRADLKA